jgi:hypothetical protein
VVVEAGELPFADRSWAIAVSSDVLEHVPTEERALFLTELVRVADRQVVLCFPCWSPEKAAAEQRLADTLEREHGVRFEFLDEHLEHGLPTVPDVVASIAGADPGATVTCWFDNSLGPGDELLVDAVRARHGRDLRALGRLARAWFRRPRLLLEHAPTASVNRVYVVIDRSTTG